MDLTWWSGAGRDVTFRRGHADPGRRGPAQARRARRSPPLDRRCGRRRRRVLPRPSPPAGAHRFVRQKPPGRTAERACRRTAEIGDLGTFGCHRSRRLNQERGEDRLDGLLINAVTDHRHEPDVSGPHRPAAVGSGDHTEQRHLRAVIRPIDPDPPADRPIRPTFTGCCEHRRVNAVPGHERLGTRGERLGLGRVGSRFCLGEEQANPLQDSLLDTTGVPDIGSAPSSGRRDRRGAVPGTGSITPISGRPCRSTLSFRASATTSRRLASLVT